MRRVFFVLALLLMLPAVVSAASLGISGEWVIYGSGDASVRIYESAGIMEYPKGTVPYTVIEQSENWQRIARKGSYAPSSGARLVKVDQDVLLLQGEDSQDGPDILLRKTAVFASPGTPIRGSWKSAMPGEDIVFDLDGNMIRFADIASGARAADLLKRMSETKQGLVLRGTGIVYHLTWLTKDFVVARESRTSLSEGGRIRLLQRVPAQAK